MLLPSVQETRRLQVRALAAIISERDDTDQIRKWLPTVAQLAFIAEHEIFLKTCQHGGAHPSLLCAALYARIGEIDTAIAIAEALIAMPQIDCDPLVRIEGWRLIARCQGARHLPDVAREALEKAVAECKAVQYAYIEVLTLREMLPYVADDVVTSQAIHQRIEAIGLPLQ